MNKARRLNNRCWLCCTQITRSRNRTYQNLSAPEVDWSAIFPALATIEFDKPLITMGVKDNDDRLVTQPLKLIQCVKTRWNSVYDMFNQLNKLRWPIVAVLSDKTVTKPSDAKTLEMKDEHWTMISQLVPVLEPLKVTALLYFIYYIFFPL